MTQPLPVDGATVAALRPRLRTRPARRSTHAHERRLGGYEHVRRGRREVVECPGAHGSRLVIDREARGLGDRRLVAHLAADEPVANADLACARYLESDPGALARCRTLTDDDLLQAPFAASRGNVFALHAEPPIAVPGAGRAYRIEPVTGRLRIPELRWRRLGAGEAVTVSLRDVVGDLEDYEPACATAARAVRASSGRAMSTTTLAVELARVQGSAIVLNRRLREVVTAALAREELSMSEIALRCGRVKRDSRGAASGETSWLARRLGLLAEGGQRAPTPWIHSDVLALIARRGLGVSPREVEL